MSTDTTVWDLAAATGQPLETVIFQAVAYDAWTEGGRIDATWAAALEGVLRAHHPWRRQTPTHTAGTTAEPAHATADATAADATEDQDPVVVLAATVLANLGQPVAVDDPTLVAAVVAASIAEQTADGIIGFAEEAATWSQLAAGTLTIDDLASEEPPAR